MCKQAGWVAIVRVLLHLLGRPELSVAEEGMCIRYWSQDSLLFHGMFGIVPRPSGIDGSLWGQKLMAKITFCEIKSNFGVCQSIWEESLHACICSYISKERSFHCWWEHWSFTMYNLQSWKNIGYWYPFQSIKASNVPVFKKVTLLIFVWFILISFGLCWVS